MTLALPSAGTSMDAETQRALTQRALSKRASQSDVNGRRQFGAATDMVSIASAIANANMGIMVDMCDLATEVMALDPHLASCASKRFGALQAADWDVTPPQGLGGRDREWAAKIAGDVRQLLERLSISDVIFDLAWSLYDGRAASEVQWAYGAWGHKIAPYAVDWVHPRRLTFGASRELRVIDPFNARPFDSTNGIGVEDDPGKFLFWKPRLFREHHEREGLALRSFYWAFFKRFGWRLCMRLQEITAIPWRIIEIDGESPANPESIADARTEADELSGDTSAVMPQGTKLSVEWPGDGAGELFGETHDRCNAEISKVWLGNTSTTQQGEGNRAEGIIGKGEQDIIFQRDGNGASRRLDPMIRTFVRLNHGDEAAMRLMPKFQLRTQPMRDRQKEAERMKLALSIGITIPESEAREALGIRPPLPDEKFLRMGAGGTDAMGNPTAGAVEVVDPTQRTTEDGEPTAERAEDDVEERGTDGQAEDAVRSLLGLSRAYASPAICCAAEIGKTVPASAIYGSPEVLVSRGIAEGVRATSAWVAQLSAAVDGLSDAVSIRRALAAAELDPEALARSVEKRLVHGAMLGALDAEWEAENDRVVKPPAFSIQSNRRASGTERARIIRASRHAWNVDDETHLSPWPWTGIPGCDVCGFGTVENEEEFSASMSAHSTCPECRTLYPSPMSATMSGAIALAGGVKDFSASPFQEAIRIFKQRNVVTRRAFDRLQAQAKQRAFTVANLAGKDVLELVKADLVTALEEGDDLRRFSARVKERTELAGWVKENPSHVENVFRTNTMGAYSRGREEQMNQPSVLAARPFRQLLGVKDSRTRKFHAAAHGKVLRHDDAAVARLRTPLGFMCRCRWVSRSAKDVERLGLTVVAGASLSGLPDEGWDGPGGF